MVDEALLRDIKDPSFAEKATISKLLRWSKNIYYLDIIGLGPQTYSFSDYWLEERKSDYRPTLYARVLEDEGYWTTKVISGVVLIVCGAC